MRLECVGWGYGVWWVGLSLVKTAAPERRCVRVLKEVGCGFSLQPLLLPAFDWVGVCVCACVWMLVSHCLEPGLFGELCDMCGEPMMSPFGPGDEVGLPISRQLFTHALGSLVEIVGAPSLGEPQVSPLLCSHEDDCVERLCVPGATSLLVTFSRGASLAPLDPYEDDEYE
jgi:hypothetical protein